MKLKKTFVVEPPIFTPDPFEDVLSDMIAKTSNGDKQFIVDIRSKMMRCIDEAIRKLDVAATTKPYRKISRRRKTA